jgi:hypothetical protein
MGFDCMISTVQSSNFWEKKGIERVKDIKRSLLEKRFPELLVRRKRLKTLVIPTGKVIEQD